MLLKHLQTNGGGEFKSLDPYLKKSSITHRLTYRYTSKQNGVVERQHRQIVEIELVLLAQASLPLAFWVDAFCSVVYLINRLPMRVLNEVSLMEKHFGQ